MKPTANGTLHGRAEREPPIRRRALASALAASLALAHGAAPTARALADDAPPDIRHEPVREIAAGGTAPVEATVVDDGGVAGVTLKLDFDGKGFTAADDQAMESRGDDRWFGQLSAEELEEGTSIRYYITATDTAGNEQSRGFEFDPFTVTVGPPVIEVPVAEESGNRTLWAVAGAAVVLGVIALLAGGGGKSPDDPPELCCTISVQ